MKINLYSIPALNYTYIELEKGIVDHLWGAVREGRQDKQDYKKLLAGNISESFIIKDHENFFFENACLPAVQKLLNETKKPPTRFNTLYESSPQLILGNFWANFQYKYEFNPIHSHGGVYSFVVWMKIPYSTEELRNSPQFKGTPREQVLPGCFAFQYIDGIGEIQNLPFELSSNREGHMLLFPSALRHCVYPFHGTDEPRISLSGNLFFKDML